MAAPKFNRERAARILVDAIELGDRKAAEKWKITDRTLRNYRARLSSDPLLSGLVVRKGQAAEATWHVRRANVLCKAADRAAILLETETDLDKVSRVMKEFGDLDISAAGLGLNVGAGADREGGAAPEAPGEAGGGEGDGADLTH